MITCDADVLILAAKAHVSIEFRGLPRPRAAARLIAARGRKSLHIPSICGGQAIAGAPTQREIDLIMGFFARLHVIHLTQRAVLRGARLRRLLGRKPSATPDCIIYAQSALAGAQTHYSYDKGMIGGTNRSRIPSMYSNRFTGNAPSLASPLEMTMTNPMRRKKIAGTEVERAEAKLMREVRSIKNRAYRKAKADGCRSDADFARYFAGVAETYLGG